MLQIVHLEMMIGNMCVCVYALRNLKRQSNAVKPKRNFVCGMELCVHCVQFHTQEIEIQVKIHEKKK